MERLAYYRIDVAMACVSPLQMPVAARFGVSSFQESLFNGIGRIRTFYCERLAALRQFSDQGKESCDAAMILAQERRGS